MGFSPLVIWGISAPKAPRKFLRPKNSLFQDFPTQWVFSPLVIEGGPDRVGEKTQQIGLMAALTHATNYSGAIGINTDPLHTV